MLDPVKERFVQEFHISGNGSESVRIAHPKARNWKPQTVHVKASQWLADAKVQIRLRELQQGAQDRHDVTVDSITEELEEARKLALTEKQSSAAVSASLGKAKLHGLIVDKSEVTRKRDVADLSDSELAAIATGRGQGTPAPKNGARGPDPVH